VEQLRNRVVNKDELPIIFDLKFELQV